jgi:hypothetical protein
VLKKMAKVVVEIGIVLGGIVCWKCVLFCDDGVCKSTPEERT